MSQETLCVVFFCDEKFFDKFMKSCQELKINGGYTGDICLIINESLHDLNIYEHPFIIENNINVVFYKSFEFSENFHKINQQTGRYQMLLFHKMNIFNTYFKKWDYVMYIDSGMKIYNSINPFYEILKPGCFYAHSDSYSTYEVSLDSQFANIDEKYNKQKLRNFINIDVDYFQTGVLIFDTRKYIQENTIKDFIILTEEFPNTNTNEQGILNLYFYHVWEQLPFFAKDKPYVRLYDFKPRFELYKYIMCKYDRDYKFDIPYRVPIYEDPVITGVFFKPPNVVPRSNTLKSLKH